MPIPIPIPMASSRRSHARRVNLDKQAWFVDSSATKHMTWHRLCFSTFKSIPQETWSVAVVDDRDFWVRGIGDIKIIRSIDGVQKIGLNMQKVIFIPDMQRNLFSKGLASKAGLYFRTLGDKCPL